MFKQHWLMENSATLKLPWCNLWVDFCWLKHPRAKLKFGMWFVGLVQQVFLQLTSTVSVFKGVLSQIFKVGSCKILFFPQNLWYLPGKAADPHISPNYPPLAFLSRWFFSRLSGERWDMYGFPRRVLLNQFGLDFSSQCNPPSVEIFEDCQVCGVIDGTSDELENNSLWLFERNTLMTLERQKTDCFCKTNNGYLVELNERHPNLPCQGYACQMCAVWLPQGVDTWQPTLLNMAGLKLFLEAKWPRKYNRCFASQTLLTLVFDGMAYNYWGMFHDV